MMEFLSSPVVEVIKAIIDILAVAYLLYFLYSLFENTNSINILKGLVVIVIINIITNLLDLKTLAWIFEYMVNYIVIILVVLFQPEIRRMLSRVGRSGLRAFRQKISPETVQEITNAVYMMSEERIGALIILERNVGLNDLLEGATQFEASVKSELLYSIFYKNNILHDGGVLIESDKIVAARVIIPSLVVGTISKARKNLGTRHRAGLAITVETDAVSVIVSEETGRVSIAHEGKLETGLTDEKFARRLNEILGNE